MNTLIYVSIFSDDVPGLSAYYERLFGLKEIARDRSSYFRSLKAGNAALGFSTQAARAILNLEDRANIGGKTYLTFGTDDRESVDSLTETAVAEGGSLVKPPFETYYGAYLSVLSDPEGNVFRISTRG